MRSQFRTNLLLMLILFILGLFPVIWKKVFSGKTPDLSNQHRGIASLQAGTQAGGLLTNNRSRRIAKTLYSRLACVPPNLSELQAVSALIDIGDLEGAADLVMSDPSFLSCTVKNWVQPWSDRDFSPYQFMNDMTATIIGFIRDNRSFDGILYEDVTYTCGANSPAAFDIDNNAHYEQCEFEARNNLGGDFSSFLSPQSQSGLLGYGDNSGVLTSRGWGFSHFFLGTNRRAVEFSMKVFLCEDLKGLNDVNVPDFRVRQDVDRAPGGEFNTFKTSCVGCHAGMDGLTGAFAYFDWDRTDANQRVVRSPGAVRGKYTKNSGIFNAGFITTDDSWINLWNIGPNARVGWNGASQGFGANSYGRMLAATDAFPSCMAKRTFTRFCQRSPLGSERELISQLATDFRDGGFSMRDLIRSVATLPQCLGE